MLIDWFTVVAQAVNFLILAWLLKRFLYRPILDSIAAREKGIAAKLADAAAKEAEAKKEQEDFQNKNNELDMQKGELMNKAMKAAEDTRAALLKEAQAEAEALRSKKAEALKNDEDHLSQEILKKTRDEVFAIAAKALRDLADDTLESRMSTVFIKHLQNLTDEEKHTLSASSSPVLVTSAFTLAAEQQNKITAAIKEITGNDKLQFKIMPELISGIELSVSGHKLAWSIADYLTTLEKDVNESRAKKADPKPELVNAA